MTPDITDCITNFTTSFDQKFPFPLWGSIVHSLNCEKNPFGFMLLYVNYGGYCSIPINILLKFNNNIKLYYFYYLIQCCEVDPHSPYLMLEKYSIQLRLSKKIDKKIWFKWNNNSLANKVLYKGKLINKKSIVC